MYTVIYVQNTKWLCIHSLRTQLEKTTTDSLSLSNNEYNKNMYAQEKTFNNQKPQVKHSDFHTNLPRFAVYGLKSFPNGYTCSSYQIYIFCGGVQLFVLLYNANDLGLRYCLCRCYMCVSACV